MTTPFTIPHTAQEISDAVSQVVNADATPQTPSTNMVTSEGIKAYVDGAVTGLTTNSFAATTLVTESDAIGSNDNDTTIPTSAAVKDFVDVNNATVKKFFAENQTGTIQGTGNNDILFDTDGHFSGNWSITDNSGSGFTNNGDGTFSVLEEGFYCVRWAGEFKDDSSQGHDIRIQSDRTGTNGFYNFTLGVSDYYRASTNSYNTLSAIAYDWVKAGGIIKVIQTRVNGSGGELKYRNTSIEITKL